MAEELSIEETNVLRAKLGLAPLRVIETNSSKEEELRLKIDESKRKRAAAAHKITAVDENEEEEEDEEKDFEITDLEKYEEGSIAVLDDVSVLDGSKLKKKENGEIGTKKHKPTLLSAIARGDAVDLDKKQIELDAPQHIPGAQLFRSDLLEENDTLSIKKKRKRNEPAKEQSKILRRTIHRGSSVLDEREDSSDLDVSIVAPKSYGNARLEIENDDAEDLEQTLAKARKQAQQNKPTIREILLTQVKSETSREEEELEKYYPKSSFVSIAPEEMVSKRNHQMDTSNTMEESNEIPSREEEEKVISQMEIEQKPIQEKPPQPSILIPEKTHKRGLAATLSVLKEAGEGKGKRDEIIVGRANDVRPPTDINRPGDQVILEYRDDHGRLLTQKEAYRQLKYDFRGEGPGPRKQKLREKQLEREQAARSAAGATSSAPSSKDLLANMKKDHIVLWKN